MDATGVGDEALSAAPRLTRLKVLVVDAHEINRLVVRLILEHTGAEVTCAASPDEALEQLAHRPFDAIVTDGAMPGFPGRGSRMLLGDPDGPNPSVPVVSLSGVEASPELAASQPVRVRLSIGGAIDPAALCAGLVRIHDQVDPGFASVA